MFKWIVWVIIPLLLYPLFKFKGRKTSLPENFASFEMRLAAIIIDLIIIDLVAYCIIIIMAQFINKPLIFYYFGLRFLLAWLDFMFLTWFTGASLGKLILKLKVTKKNGEPAGFIDIFYREIVKNFSFCCFNLGFLSMLINEKKLTWHDGVADTIVVCHKPVHGYEEAI